MPILLDIGNTAITYGIYSGGRLHANGSTLYNGIPKLALKWSNSGLYNDKNVVLSSVVPKITKKVQKYFNPAKGWKMWVAGKNLPLKIHHKYKEINKLGIDRRVNIYGAIRIYKLPLLIFDFGTALTVDYVSAKGVFEGGLIIPGPEISFQALIGRAALLPKNARLPRKAFRLDARNTVECMNSGILFGYGAMVDGLVDRFKHLYGNKLRVLATGGFSQHLKPFVRSFNRVDPLHSLKSLLLLYKDSLQ